MTVKALKSDMWRVVLACLCPENRRICEVALQTGLRISDVLSLKTCDLCQKMIIREIKTGKTRAVEIDGETFTELLAGAGEVYVFQHRNDINKHKTRQAVWKDLRHAAEKLHLGGYKGRGIGTHSMRKSYAKDMLEKAHGDVKAVQRDFRHADILCTTIYALAEELQMRG